MDEDATLRSIDIRFHLTGPRRRVLEIVTASPGSSLDEIVAAWVAAEPSLSTRRVAALPQMVSQILWRLENLGWVAPHESGFCITVAGKAAKNFSLRDA